MGSGGGGMAVPANKSFQKKFLRWVKQTVVHPYNGMWLNQKKNNKIKWQNDRGEHISSCQGWGVGVTMKGSTRGLGGDGTSYVLTGVVGTPTYTRDKTTWTTHTHTKGCMSNWWNLNKVCGSSQRFPCQCPRFDTVSQLQRCTIQSTWDHAIIFTTSYESVIMSR